jgi:ion channel-forming bestrophin family protein
MILKRNFNPVKVLGYVRFELLMSISVSIFVFIIFENKAVSLAFPFSITAILGSALAIFIAFRNNSAYGRWWEARTLWGGIVNSSRVLTRLIITFTDSHAHQPGYDRSSSERFKKEMVFLCIAWVHALRLHLREQESWEEIKPYIPESDFETMLAIRHKPNFIHLIMGKKIYRAMAEGILGGFDSFQLEGQLLALTNYQGGCERIKNTPLLRQYDYFTRLFLYVFILVLPFTLIGDFSKIDISFLMPPVAILISFVFSIISKVGEVNEDPFENRITDVPLTSLCNTIEINLLEMLGENQLPEKVVSEKGFIF